ncbi:MAG: response regulator [Oligoflexales bacterium]
MKGLSKGKRILVVDDEQDFLDLLVAAFSESGYEVLKASNGFEALKIFGRMKVDAIVTDLTMPGMDGIQMISYLKVNSLNAKSPVFVVSGKLSETSLKMLNNLGIIHIVPKPVDLIDLVHNVDEVLLPQVRNESPFEEEITNLFNQALCETLSDYFPKNIESAPAATATQKSQEFEYTSSIPLFGTRVYGAIQIGCDYQFIRELAKKVFQTNEIDITPEVATDMTGELINQVAGLAKRKLESKKLYSIIGLPITAINASFTQLIPASRLALQAAVGENHRVFAEICLGDPSKLKADQTNQDLPIYRLKS